jgi:hypothetical protein
MRNFLETGRSGRRTQKLKQKYRSRFKDGVPRSGSRLIQRFRRNRQYQAKEFTTFVLWLSIGLMLIPMGRSLWRVAQAHLSERPIAFQLSLPAIAGLAMIFCMFRARASWGELRLLRQEQKELLRGMREDLEDLDPT